MAPRVLVGTCPICDSGWHPIRREIPVETTTLSQTAPVPLTFLADIIYPREQRPWDIGDIVKRIEGGKT